MLPSKENEVIWNLRCTKTGRLYHLTEMKKYYGIEKIQYVPIYEGCRHNDETM